VTRSRTEDGDIASRRSAPGDSVFRLLVENVEDYAMCAMNPRGEILHWNAGAVRTFGYREDEVRGKTLSLIFTEEDVRAGLAEQELRVAAEQGRAEDERWHVRKDGSRFWAMGVLVPVRDERGAIIGFGKIVRDRTDLKQLQEMLRSRTEELAKANEDKNVFLGTLAHELRTPLGVLANAVELLRRDAVDRLRVAGMLDRQVQHCKRLVDDLIDIVRVGRNKLQLNRMEVDVRDTLSHAAEMTRPTFEQQSKTFLWDAPPVPLMVDGDPDRLLQIFVNLLANACKYTNGGGRVVLSATSEGNEAVIRVVDDGVGIPPEQVHAIFDLFSQVHPSLPGSQVGVGIGLALTRDLVLLHDGTIQARSPGLGLGSEFIVRLPLNSGAQSISAGISPGTAPPGAAVTSSQA
jgi:PAS domain S-box-containing protein